MDQPQHQVLRTEQQSYRYMAYPFQKQPLHLLYPGRIMEQEYHYTGENIPNEDPFGLEKTQAQTVALARAAKMEREALARHLGGKDKIARHPAVEPEAVIEDPDLARLSINTSFGLEGGLQTVPSNLGNLQNVEDRTRKIAGKVRKSLESGVSAQRFEEDVLPRYDWQASDTIQNNIIETYAHNNSDPLVVIRPKTRNSKFGLWIALAVVGILAVVFIVLIIYGIYKHRSYAKAIQPKIFHVVSPQYLPPGMKPDIIGSSPASVY